MRRSTQMKTAALIVGLAAALGAAAAPARAQSIMSLGIAAGASIPTSDLADAEQTGFNVTVALGSQPPLLPIGFRAEGSLNQFTGKEERIAGITVSNDDLRLFNLSGNVILQAPGLLLRPYVIGGVGYYNVKFKGDDKSEGKFGWNAGVGAKFSLTGFSTYAEVRYHRANLDDNFSLSYVPITFGIMF